MHTSRQISPGGHCRAESASQGKRNYAQHVYEVWLAAQPFLVVLKLQILCVFAPRRITACWVASNISTIGCAALSRCDPRRLLQFLGSARSTIDVCVFTITCDEIAEALLAAQKRGVRVRIISDNDQVCDWHIACGAAVLKQLYVSDCGVVHINLFAGCCLHADKQGTAMACTFLHQWAAEDMQLHLFAHVNLCEISTHTSTSVHRRCCSLFSCLSILTVLLWLWLQSKTQGSDVERLRAAGIPVALDADQYHSE